MHAVSANQIADILHFNDKLMEVRNSQVTTSSYEIKLRKMTSLLELLTQTFLQKFFF